ncbi:hypothetical protein [Pelomonas cellulosilytica]|uniref:Transmembrane protein n=1 Tax=Pelomonas cellulosilytica TaxID=2906762 RepID=A0ABS8XMA6_9BURK|nr:hypothetical protein [Pelomonas sp. P8]MCE4553909.1 hypothetical protein [Pelomonas sp. P8]
MKRWWPGLLLSLLLAWPGVRDGLESRMSLHMAAELPMLLAAGAWLAGVLPWPGRLLQWLDAGGLLAATTASAVLALWMVPAALDLALLQPGVALLKYGSWLAAGGMLRLARPRFTPVVAAFFLANAAWMTATAGLLYLDAEQQLCVNYLVSDQQVAGWALVAWAIAMGAAALAALRPVIAARA